MEQKRGSVIAVAGSEATVELEDGSTLAAAIPDMIQVEVGMPVTIVDVGDGRPIYAWGK